RERRAQLGDICVGHLRGRAERRDDALDVLDRLRVVDELRLERHQDVGELLRRAGLVDGGRLVRSEHLGDQVACELGEGLDLGHACVNDHITLEDALATLRVVEGRVDMYGRHSEDCLRSSRERSSCALGFTSGFTLGSAGAYALESRCSTRWGVVPSRSPLQRGYRSPGAAVDPGVTRSAANSLL